MNDRTFSYSSPNADELLIRSAFEALQKAVAIKAKLVELAPISSAKYQADALIDLVHENGATRYYVECKSSVDRKTQLDKIRRQLASTGSPGLLIAQHISKELAAHCRATDLQFIDTSGNAYLHAPGLLVFIKGEKTEGESHLRPPKGLTNTAALRVVFALLAKPDHVNSPYKDIAQYVNVSLGTAYNVLDDLERRGYLINKGSAERRKLLEPARLMDEWAINYPATLRTKLNARRFSAPEPDWWEDIDLHDVDFAWGSEVAAMKMTGYLKPGTQTLYVAPDDMDSAIKTLSKQHRIRPDQNGNLEILEKFWHWKPVTPSDTAPPLLVYSELLALLDPRTQETADMIKERFIDHTFDQG